VPLPVWQFQKAERKNKNGFGMMCSLPGIQGKE